MTIDRKIDKVGYLDQYLHFRGEGAYIRVSIEVCAMLYIQYEDVFIRYILYAVISLHVLALSE